MKCDRHRPRISCRYSASHSGIVEARRSVTLTCVSSFSDRRLSGHVRHPIELVDHVSVGAEREPGVVPELARNIDDGAALVKEQRSEGMAEIVRAGIIDAGCLELAAKLTASRFLSNV